MLNILMHGTVHRIGVRSHPLNVPIGSKIFEKHGAIDALHHVYALKQTKCIFF